MDNSTNNLTPGLQTGNQRPGFLRPGDPSHSEGSTLNDPSLPPPPQPPPPNSNLNRHNQPGVAMSTGSRSSSHFSQSSGQSSGSHSDHASEPSEEQDSDATSVITPGTYRERTQAWWTVGEYLENGRVPALTHQSAKFTLTGNRVFANQREELWDLSDSLMELYEANQTANLNATLQITKKGKHLNKDVDVKDWLSKDTTHGFIRVFAPEADSNRSKLVPCTLSTSAHKICLMLGISLNALHVQMNGDIIRRLDPYEHPLVLQNEYLAGLGFNDIGRIQQEGVNEELGFLIRYYAGKPYHDSTFSRNQLQAYIDIRKGKVIHQWTRRLCVISGTRLLIYKDKMKRSRPTVVQLAKGAVEEVKFKGHDLCLKLTSTLQGERSIYLSFIDVSEYNRWYRKCKKATDKLPTSADLSNCHLEFLPETIFINDQLSMLNLRHNVLKERPIEEDIYTIGWIDDIPRFSCLRSLNLADNNLHNFPLSLCFIKTLVELNLASNKLSEIPPEIAELTNLQALHIHNNHLSILPDEMVSLRKLFILVIAFNYFTSIPLVVANMTDVRVSEVENIIMAGNQIERLSVEILSKMKYVKKVDLRMNQLTLPPSETMKFTMLEHITHLDIRDNRIGDLDIRALKVLEYLNCERNDMTTLQINGAALKNLFANSNEIETLQIHPKPEWLLQIEISHNNLLRLPEWLSDCFFLQKIYASHNQLVELPSRLFLDAKKLKSLRVDHNQLVSLPAEVDTMFIEEILLHNNKISVLPPDFLDKAIKLRILNLSRNKLCQLPVANDNLDLNKIQELYLTGNMFSDSVMSVVSLYPRLKVLHLAQNELHDINDSELEKLEMLQEVNLSGNQLRSLPVALGRLPKLVVLRAHTNLLSTLPDFHLATALRVLDVGHNQLLNVSVTSLMASQINLLDMSLNAQLKVDPQEFRSIKNKKTVCLVDLTGQNRRLPGLGSKLPLPEEQVTDEMDPSSPWKAGFSETSGSRNKLCVATLKILQFGSENDALFAMFDGGHNNEVPKRLLEIVPNLLHEELQQERTRDKYMKYAMLAAHGSLQTIGQRLGASGVVSHIRRMAANQMNNYSLSLANVGDVEAVLCRRGDSLVLTKKFTTHDNKEESYRVYKSDGIVTEDGKVNGTTKNTRLLGCAFLHPHVVPDPYTHTVTLRHDDEFIIIANRGLWKFVGYDEAVQEVYEIGNPVVAAKKLQDLAQGYGSKENIAVLVIRLNTDSQPSLGRLRKNRSMSIDDVEAAAQHQARMADLPPRLRASTGKIKRPAPLAPPPASVVTTEYTQNGTGPEHEGEEEEAAEAAAVVSDIVDTIDGPDHSYVNGQWNGPEGGEGQNMVNGKQEEEEGVEDEVVEEEGVEEEEEQPEVEHVAPTPVTPDTDPESEEFVEQMINVDGTPRPSRKNRASTISTSTSSPVPELRPLPNQRFRKKTAASDWETILQKRLTNDVKDKEIKHLSQTLGGSDDDLDVDRDVIAVDIDINEPHPDTAEPRQNWSSQSHKQGLTDSNKGKFGSMGRTNAITTPWTDASNRRPNTANPAYLHQEDTNDNDVMTMTTQIKEEPKEQKVAPAGGGERPRVSRMIGMFEDINRQSKVNFGGRQSFRSQTRHRSVSRDRSQSGERTLDYQNGSAGMEVPIYAQVKKSRQLQNNEGSVVYRYSRSQPTEDNKDPIIVEIARL